MIKTLTFGFGNAKLNRDTAIISLPAGHTCKFADLCRSNANRETGKITDGPHCQFRCYATLPENLFANVRNSRWRNFELLRKAKTVIGMANLIESSLVGKKNIKLVRMHASGDFWSQEYFDAWLLFAQQHSEWTFYGYTKALPYWIKRLNSIPTNMKLVASRGGTHDVLIDALGLRSVKVVFSEEEAEKLGLELDHDDCLCWKGDKDFAILLHSTQPKGSDAGKAWYKISKHGQGGYKADYFHHYEKSGKGKKAITVPAVTIKPASKQLVNPNPRAGKITITTNGLTKVLGNKWIKVYA